MNIEKYIDKINNASRELNEKLDSRLDDIKTIEFVLEKSKLNFPISIEIGSDTDDVEGGKYLSWEPCASSKRFRIIFKGNVLDKDKTISLISKPFIETKLHVRLRYINYLYVLVDKITEETNKFLVNELASKGK